jgi:hypothetical protein
MIKSPKQYPQLMKKNNKISFLLIVFAAACNSKNNEDHTHQRMRDYIILVQWIRRLRKISLKMPHLSHGFPMKRTILLQIALSDQQIVGNISLQAVAETENSLQESYTEY